MSEHNKRNIDDLFSKERLEKEFKATDADWSALKDIVLGGSEAFEPIDDLFSKEKLEQEFTPNEGDWSAIKDDVLVNDKANLDQLFTADKLQYDFKPEDSDWREAKESFEGVQNVDLLFTKERMDIDFTPSEGDWEEVKDQVIPKKKRRWLIVLLFIGLFALLILLWLNNTSQRKNAYLPVVDNSTSTQIIGEEAIDLDKNKPQNTPILTDIESNAIDRSFVTSPQSRITKKEVILDRREDMQEGEAKRPNNDNKNFGPISNANPVTAVSREQEDAENAINNELRNQGVSRADESVSSKESTQSIGSKDIAEDNAIQSIEDLQENVQNLKDEIGNLSPIIDLETDLLPIEKALPSMQIIPVRDQWTRSLKASVHGSTKMNMAGIYLGMDVLKLSKRWTMDAGLSYSYLANERLIEMKEQSIFSFGVSKRSATLIIKDIHYLGLRVNLDYQIYKRLTLGLGINPKYRYNARAKSNYYTNTGSLETELVSIENRHTKDFNFSFMPELKYNFNHFDLGIGYEYYHSNGIRISSENGDKSRGEIIVSLSRSF